MKKAKRKMIADDIGWQEPEPPPPPRSPEERAFDDAFRTLLDPHVGEAAADLLVGIVWIAEAFARSDKAKAIGEGKDWLDDEGALPALAKAIGVFLDRVLHPEGSLAEQADRRNKANGIKAGVDALTGLEINWVNLPEIACWRAIDKNPETAAMFPGSAAEAWHQQRGTLPDPLSLHG